MKKLNLIIIALIIGSYSCQGQHNILSESEFDEVKFGNANLIEIVQSLGDINQMNSLFENDLTHAANNTGFDPGRDFWLKDKLYINFENESGNQYDLSYIDILSSSISVTVKGIEVRLGDHINIFGNNIEIIEYPDEKIVNFTDEGTGTSSLAFHINPTTNRITEITFNVYWYFWGHEKNIDLIKNPDLVKTDTNAVISALWFYDNKVNITIDSKTTVEKVTRKVNGGTNGIKDRENKLKKVKINIDCK